MKTGYKIVISMAVLLVLAVLAYLPVDDNNKTTGTSKTEPANTQAQQHVINQESSKLMAGDNLTEANTPDHLSDGVNPIFKDKPAIQIAWMERGKNILLNNNPQAESADFRNTYFHRSFNDRPVTCGEVQLSKNGIVTAGFQRFIYVGLQSSHLEHDVTNFDILWSKMCIQTLDE